MRCWPTSRGFHILVVIGFVVEWKSGRVRNLENRETGSGLEFICEVRSEVFPCQG